MGKFGQHNNIANGDQDKRNLLASMAEMALEKDVDNENGEFSLIEIMKWNPRGRTRNIEDLEETKKFL